MYNCLVGPFCTNALSCIYPDSYPKQEISAYTGPSRHFKLMLCYGSSLTENRSCKMPPVTVKLEWGAKPFIIPYINKHLHTVLLLKQSASQSSPHQTTPFTASEHQHFNHNS